MYTLEVITTLNFVFYSKPFKVLSLVAPDGSAKANFIPFGATATNFWVKDKVSK